MNVKKIYGEVNTPPFLRKLVLDVVPSAFWTTSQRVLEPCCGDGGFVQDIIQRFMDGLATPKDETKRYKWIVENCIYWGDINPTNVKLVRKKVDPKKQYKLLSFTGDSLTEFPEWETFDAVITNPPYQMPTGLRKGGWGNKTLWDKFVDQTLDVWLKPAGYFLCIHPSKWRKPENPLWLKLRDKIQFLSIHDEKDGQETFHCATRYDWYMMQNQPSLTPALVFDERGESHMLDLKQWPFLPNAELDLFSPEAKLFDFTQTNTFDVIFDRSLFGTDKKHISFEKGQSHPHPVIHSMNRKGITYVYSTKKDTKHFRPKVVLSTGRYPYPYLDAKGKYGMSQIAFGLPVKSTKEGEQIVAGLNHPLMKQMFLVSKWCSFYVDYRLFRYLRRDFYAALPKY